MDVQRGVQYVFRAANQRLRARAERLRGPRPVICECSDENCLAVLELTPREYERIRMQGNFVVLTGHDLPEIERVVEQRDGYAIVDKT